MNAGNETSPAIGDTPMIELRKLTKAFGSKYALRGVDLFVQMLRKRYSRSRPCTPSIARQSFGIRAILYRLRAKIEVAPIAEEEVRATGWDRSDYATR